MCNDSNNINILSEKGQPLITINDSYLNDKINEFKNFLLNFNQYFNMLDNILESRLHKEIDSIALNLYNDDFLINVDFKNQNLNLEMILFNTFNLLYNYKNKKHVTLNNDNNISVLFNKDNNYYSLNLEKNDNIVLVKHSDLSDLKIDKDVFILEKDLEEYIQYLLNIY